MSLRPCRVSCAPRALALWTSLLLVGSIMPGCTLLSVGTLVGKRFAPALGKGDKEALKRCSSPRLAGYWDAFTEQEIKAAMGADSRGGMKARKAGGRQPGKKKKAPSVGLVSFKAHGHTATLVVRQGTQRFRFLCLRTADGWKVDNVFFTFKGKPRELSKMLQVLVAAKALQQGLEQGSRYLLYNISTPALRESVFQRLRDEELQALSEVANPLAHRVKGAKRPRPARIESEDTPTGFLVRSKGGDLSAEIRLVETDGQILVDGVSLQLGGSWHSLGDLLSYLSPAMQLLRWAGRHLRPTGEASTPPSDAALASLLSHLEGIFSERLWRGSLGWLTPADLKLLPWALVRSALSPKARAPKDGARPKPDAASRLGPRNITLFERRGDRLHVEAKLPGWRVGLTFLQAGQAWRLDNAFIEQPGQRVELDTLLAALGPLAKLGATFARLSPELALGPARSRAAIESLLDAVRAASSADANRRLWSRIPPALIRNLPLEALPKDLRTLIMGASRPSPGHTAQGSPVAPRTGPPAARPPADPHAAARPPAGPHAAARPPAGPHAAARPPADPHAAARPPASAHAAARPSAFRLERLQQTPDSLRIQLVVAGRPLALHLVREAKGWKLDDLVVPLAGQRRSLKAVGALLLPAVSLAQAVLVSDAQALRHAMTPALRHDVVDPLLAILGPRFATLMKTLRDSALPKASKASADDAAPSQSDTDDDDASPQAGSRDKPAARPRGLRASAKRAAGRLARRAAGTALRRAVSARKGRGTARAARPSSGTPGDEPGADGHAPKPRSTGLQLSSFNLDEVRGRAEIGLSIGPEITLAITLTRDAEGDWAIADLRFPLAGREVTLSRVGPVLGPVLGFGLSLMAGDLGGVRRASSSSFNQAAWYKMSPARFKKLVKQITDDGSKPGGKGGSRGAAGKAGARPKPPAPPKLVALRIRDDVRWHWAEIELELGGRRILAALVKERGNWKVHDLEVQLGGMALSVKKLIALGL